MKVILREDVDDLGAMGETVNVSPGYARNFLIPRKYAVAAAGASAKQIEHELRIIKKREEKLRKEQGEYKQALDGTRLEFTAKSSEEGKLFGSITSLHIAEQLKEKGHDVDRKRIMLKDHLKSLGEHEVRIRLAPQIEATIVVAIVPEEVPEEEVEAEVEAATEGEVEPERPFPTMSESEFPPMAEEAAEETTPE